MAPRPSTPLLGDVSAAAATLSGVAQKKQRPSGVRLADIRVPRLWRLALVAGMSLGLWQRRRDLRALAETGKELGKLTTQRWQEGDARADRLIRLTETLARLTWVLLGVTAVALAVAMVALVRG